MSPLSENCLSNQQSPCVGTSMNLSQETDIIFFVSTTCHCSMDVPFSLLTDECHSFNAEPSLPLFFYDPNMHSGMPIEYYLANVAL